MGGDGRGCNKIAGSFVVRELGTNASGAVNKLWLTYEQHCEGGKAALFGEVRLGYAPPTGPAAIPTRVDFPANELQRQGSAQPVTLVASESPVTVSRVALVGPDAGAFSIRADECTGKILQPGASCQVFVRAEGTQAGAKQAALQLARAGGGVTEVALSGTVRGGRTRFVMDSEPGDFIGAGRDITYTPADAEITASGSRRLVRFSVRTNNGDSWTAEFAAGEGDILASGRRYTGATRYPFNNGGNGLAVSGSGRVCTTLTGEFTVDELRFDPDGTLEGASISYEQHCEDGTPALRGIAEFRAGEDPKPSSDPVAKPFTPPADIDGAPGPPAYDAATIPAMAGPSSPTPAFPVPGTEPAGARKPAATSAAAPAATSAAAPAVALDAGERALCGRRRLATRRVRVGSDLADRIRATAGGDVLAAGGGNDRVWAGGGDDCVAGGAGDDRLDGGTGRDVLIGGPGNDVLVGGPGRDLLVCGAGRDRAVAGREDRTRGCERVQRVR